MKKYKECFYCRTVTKDPEKCEKCFQVSMRTGRKIGFKKHYIRILKDIIFEWLDK